MSRRHTTEHGKRSRRSSDTERGRDRGTPGAERAGRPARRPRSAAQRRAPRHRLRRRLPAAASLCLTAFVLLILFGPVLMLALFSFNDSSIISLPWRVHDPLVRPGVRQPGDRRGPELAAGGLDRDRVLAGAGDARRLGLTRLRFPGRGFVAGLHGSVLVVPWLIIGVAGLIFFSELGVTLSLQTIGLMHRGDVPARGRDHLRRPGPVLALAGGGRDRPRRLATADDAPRRPPHIAPSLAAAGIFAFAWSFNNFEISFFLGGFEQTFPVWVFSILRQSENLPLVNAVSTVIALAQVIAVFGAWRLMKRLTRNRGGDNALTELVTGGVR